MKNVPRARTKNRLIRVSIACAAILGGIQAAGQQSLEQILKNGVVVPGKEPPAAATTAKPAKQPPSAAPAARTAAPAAASAGFRMDLPPGWRAQLAQNGAIVAAGQDGSAVVIAPILGAGGADAGTWLHDSGAAAVGQYLKSAVMTGIYQSRMGPSAALASFDYAGPSGAGGELRHRPPQVAPTAKLLNATHPDLFVFEANGGKLIMWQGWSDPNLTPFRSVRYFLETVLAVRRMLRVESRS
ncbi:MAG: tannase/feruloyl esterase family alpha/beta hydrolase [Acidobacteriia bacterium]|nr:tannase/feruloyl esterase family alpha/beta hydrolase [Terriglobia bacterium]